MQKSGPYRTGLTSCPADEMASFSNKITLNSKASKLLDWIVPLAILGVFTTVLRLTTLDLDLAGLFYHPVYGWHHSGDEPWNFLYHYGVVPAWILSVGSLLLLIISIWKRSLIRYRRIFVYLVLVMIIGPGLVVNSAFKERWGRPRPVDIPEFGGNYEFLSVWERGNPDRGQSFPSGHASTGFYFFALYFVLRGRSKWAYVWLVIAVGYGSIIGLARMIQGKHFLSDVVWAAGFVYLTALLLNSILFRYRREYNRLSEGGFK